MNSFRDNLTAKRKKLQSAARRAIELKSWYDRKSSELQEAVLGKSVDELNEYLHKISSIEAEITTKERELHELKDIYGSSNWNGFAIQNSDKRKPGLTPARLKESIENLKILCTSKKKDLRCMIKTIQNQKESHEFIETLNKHEKLIVVSLSSFLTLLGYMTDAKGERERLSQAITDDIGDTQYK